jgi:mRNA interferase MazF
MARILREEVVWVDLNPTIGNEQQGLRPVLVLSEEVFNRHSGTIIGVALTSQKPKAGFPLTYELNSDSLPKKSWVKIGQIRTLSTQMVAGKAGQVSSEELTKVTKGLNLIIGG